MARIMSAIGSVDGKPALYSNVGQIIHMAWWLSYSPGNTHSGSDDASTGVREAAKRHEKSNRADQVLFTSSPPVSKFPAGGPARRLPLSCNGDV